MRSRSQRRIAPRHVNTRPEVSNLDSAVANLAGTDRRDVTLRRQIFCATSRRKSDRAGSLGIWNSSPRRPDWCVDDYDAGCAFVFSYPTADPARKIPPDRPRARVGAALFETGNSGGVSES